ncbi:MAG: CRISPR-associated helicase Cas3' [Eubacteriales bacterium]|nr:CRISPR-associated helicase Cas3' [Eubacteriales bacterium]
MKNFIAHIRSTDNAIQSVKVHCEGVAARASEFGKSIGCQKLCELMGLLHDIGKLNDDFTMYISGDSNIKRGEIDHSYAGGKYLYVLAKEHGGGELIETAVFIGHCIMTHHGLTDWLDDLGKDTFIRRIQKDERFAEIKANVATVISEEEVLQLLYAAKEEYYQIKDRCKRLAANLTPKIKRSTFAFYMGMYERLILSMLVDADRTDTINFELDDEIEQKVEPSFWKAASEKMEEQCEQFRKKTDRISVLRMDISDRCAAYAAHEVGVCKLVVPTGGGKTYSGMRFAIEYCRKHSKDRILYCAPYLSILEQNSGVYKALFPNESYLEHHSDMIPQILNHAGGQAEQELAHYELVSQSYTDPVIATTMVSFMNIFFDGRMTSVRRMHRLCNAVILIDEVQSIPVKCVSIFNLAMNFMSHIAGTTIVLCSATQPGFENNPYALLLDKDPSMTGDYAVDFINFQRNRLVPLDCSTGYTTEEAAAFCLECLEKQGSTLFIANTKATVLAMYQILNDQVGTDTYVRHLSTGMCAEHRRDVLKDIKQLLNENKKVICVTTQLIEAGVDISFPCVVRALAGLDNAAQAAGRCNRNGEFPGIRDVYFLKLKDENPGSLYDITAAQAISQEMISSGNYDDYLDVAVMSDYFYKLYRDRQKELDYPATDAGRSTTLLQLLSVNESRCSQSSRDPDVRHQAFKSAGEKFQMIDNGTVDVIVPYGNRGKEIILALNGDISLYQEGKLLREAQKYTISVYPNLIVKLEKENGLLKLPCGTLALSENFYDEKVGISIPKTNSMELLMM